MVRQVRRTRAHKRQRELEERLKLLGSTCHTYGLAMMAAALVEPLTKSVAVSVSNLMVVGAAIVLHLVAFYLAPVGKAS